MTIDKTRTITIVCTACQTEFVIHVPAGKGRAKIRGRLCPNCEPRLVYSWPRDGGERIYAPLEKVRYLGHTIVKEVLI
jgi:hypothetical protein